MADGTDGAGMNGLDPAKVEMKSAPRSAPDSFAPFIPAPEGARPGIPGSAGEHRLQEQYNSSPRAKAFHKHQVLDHLNLHMIDFIAKQEMIFVGTADRIGEADTSFRAGEAGFVRVISPKILAYPEYRGNGVMASLGNITENPHAGLLFVDFTQRIGLHVNGAAKIVETDEFLQRFGIVGAPGTAGRRPERWVVVDVNEAYIHCSTHNPGMRKLSVDIHWRTDNAEA